MNQLGSLNNPQNMSLFEHHGKISDLDLHCQLGHQMVHQVESLERSCLWAQKGNSAEASFTTYRIVKLCELQAGWPRTRKSKHRLTNQVYFPSLMQVDASWWQLMPIDASCIMYAMCRFVDFSGFLWRVSAFSDLRRWSHKNPQAKCWVHFACAADALDCQRRMHNNIWAGSKLTATLLKKVSRQWAADAADVWIGGDGDTVVGIDTSKGSKRKMSVSKES